MRLRRMLTSSLILAALSCVAAPVADGPASAESARQFAQSFYSWYAPKANSENASPAWRAALETSDFALSPQLASALKEDLEAHDSVRGEIVGLDFDPFLFTQDPCERYDAGNAVRRGASYRVPMNAVCEGTKDGRPDVFLEVSWQGGRWTIVNAHYPGARDLLFILKALRDDRLKSEQ
jgi:hypothetical protein